MLQRLQLLVRLLGLYLSRQQGMAFLERVQASTLRDHDRDRVSHIIRGMLRLPDDPVPVHEPSAPAAPSLARPTPPHRTQRSVSVSQRPPHAVRSDTRRDRARLDTRPRTRYIYRLAERTNGPS